VVVVGVVGAGAGLATEATDGAGVGADVVVGAAGAGAGLVAGVGAAAGAGAVDVAVDVDGAGLVAGAGAGAGAGAVDVAVDVDGAGLMAGAGAGAVDVAVEVDGAVDVDGAGADDVAVDVDGALTGAVEVVVAAASATGAVAPATGRSAAAVDVAKLQAEARTASARIREPRPTRRVPWGPVCRSCPRVRSCGPRRNNGFPQAYGDDRAARDVHRGGPLQTRFRPANMPLAGPLAPLKARGDRSARAERAIPRDVQRRKYGVQEPLSRVDTSARRLVEATAAQPWRPLIIRSSDRAQTLHGHSFRERPGHPSRDRRPRLGAPPDDRLTAVELPPRQPPSDRRAGASPRSQNRGTATRGVAADARRRPPATLSGGPPATPQRPSNGPWASTRQTRLLGAQEGLQRDSRQPLRGSRTGMSGPLTAHAATTPSAGPAMTPRRGPRLPERADHLTARPRRQALAHHLRGGRQRRADRGDEVQLSSLEVAADPGLGAMDGRR
jgi:hypothetical protein